jgi:2-polyprenyl-3-methyl-5-hydroxy-6-metoxy-1,4-benzoquinol methylase
MSNGMIKYGSTTCISAELGKGINVRRDLQRCKDCGSISVDPIPTHEELNKYYNDYADVCSDRVKWEKRKSYRVVLDVCDNIKGSVLDIGCADGLLLSMLPSSLEKFGIDISEKACILARKKGIHVRCASLESAKFQNGFDLIIALDILEHTVNPRDAMKTIGGMLNPGGYVILETGNASSLTAKIFKSDWYYTAFYGHLCVLTPKMLTVIANEAGIGMVFLKRGWHVKPTLMMLLYRSMLAFGFRVFRVLSGLSIIKPLVNKIGYLTRLNDHSPPGLNLPDHMLFCGRKELK